MCFAIFGMGIAELAIVGGIAVAITAIVVGGLTQGGKRKADGSEAGDDLEAENEELRRENERLRREIQRSQ